MSEERGGGRQPDLLASLPGEPAGTDTAILEGLRSGLAEVRDEVAGVRRALEADRPAPATREELDAWGARLADRVESAARPEDPSPAGAMEAAAARTAGAADRIEAGLGRIEHRLAAEIDGLERRLAAERAEGGAVPKEIGETLDTLNETAAARRVDYRLINDALAGLRRDIAGLEFRWRAFLAPWVVFVFVLGMAAESRILVLYRLLWAG